MTVTVADAVAWLREWRDSRLRSIERCEEAALRAREYADDIITHLLTRQAALESADGWDRNADRYRRDVAMMDLLIEELTSVHA